MFVSVFPTCLVDAVTPSVAVSTVRLLRRAGHRVDVPERTTCCGQPAWNAGQTDAASTVARTTLTALRESAADVVVVPAGSCATMIRVFWSELFELVGDHDSARAATELAPRVRELSELLATDPPAVSTPDPVATAYHHSCHMLRELGIEEQPVTLTRAACPALVATTAEGRCCGFGGLFSVKLPEVSTAMADDVLDAVVAAGAEQVVGSDSSCLMHLQARAERRGLPVRFRHLAEALDEATGP